MSVKAVLSFPLPLASGASQSKQVRSVLSPAQKRLRATLQTSGRNGSLSPAADQFFGSVYVAAGRVYGPALAPRIFFRLFPDAFIIMVLEKMLENRQATMKAFFDSWGESLRENAALDRKAAERSHEDRVRLLATANARKAAADAVLHAAETAAQIAPSSRTATSRPGGAAVAATSHDRRVAPASLTPQAGPSESFLNSAETSDAPSLLSHVATLQALDLPAEDIGPALGSPRDRERLKSPKH